MTPVHFTQLRAIAKSPAHYRALLTTPRPDSPAMRTGRLVHTLLLDDAPNVLVYDGIRRGKDWDQFVAANPDRDIVLVSEMDTACNIAESVTTNQTALGLLMGNRETPINWSFAGRDCAGRPDVWTPERVVELKTSADAQPERFVRIALSMAYHAQLAWYQDGLTAAGLAFPEQAFIVAVETKPPYVVTCLELTPRALDFGRRTYSLWFERLRTCEESDYWPGYSDAIVPFDCPEDLNLVIDGEEVAA